MAICSTHVKAVTRSKGHSVIAAAAYRRGITLFDERLQLTKDYSKKSGLIYSELSLPENSPEWLKTLYSEYEKDSTAAIGKFWNFVDTFENQKNSQMARNLYFALPIELNASQNIALMKDCVKEFTSLGMVADWSIHFDTGNPHAHLLLTFRELTPEGFGLKVRKWNSWKSYKEWRFRFAETTNQHLAQNGIDARIDPRSYEEQGINLRPTIHVGKSVTAQEQRGIETERMEEQREIQNENLDRLTQNPDILFEVISNETTTFTPQKIAQTMSRYINPHDGETNLLPSELTSTNDVQIAQEIEQWRRAKSNEQLTSSLPNDFLKNSPNQSNFNEVDSVTLAANSLHATNDDIHAESTVSLDSSTIPTNAIEAFSHASQANPSAEKIIEAQVLENLTASTPEVKPADPTFFSKLVGIIETHDAVFSEKTLAAELFKLNPHVSPEQFTQTLIQVNACLRQSKNILSLGIGDDGREKFTTRAMFDLENDVQHMTDDLGKTTHATLSKTVIRQALKQREKDTAKTLTPEQRQAVNQLTGKASLACLVGIAGSGKSFC